MDFELDAKRIVDNFSSTKTAIIEFGCIIQKYKTLFSQYYENFSVEFV